MLLEIREIHVIKVLRAVHYGSHYNSSIQDGIRIMVGTHGLFSRKIVSCYCRIHIFRTRFVFGSIVILRIYQMCISIVLAMLLLAKLQYFYSLNSRKEVTIIHMIIGNLYSLFLFIINENLRMQNGNGRN